MSTFYGFAYVTHTIGWPTIFITLCKQTNFSIFYSKFINGLFSKSIIKTKVHLHQTMCLSSTTKKAHGYRRGLSKNI